MSTFPITSHSAELDMWVECDGYGRVSLGRVTPTLVVATTPVGRAIPPGRADLVVVVDGQEVRRSVHLGGFRLGRAAARHWPITAAAAPF